MSLAPLRVKIKSLAAEAAIIRNEERRAKAAAFTTSVNQLHHHRVVVVRRAARAALLAYAYLRDQPRWLAEAEVPTAWMPNLQWAVEKNVRRFGGDPDGVSKWLSSEKCLTSP